MTELEIIQGCKKRKPNCQKELVVRYSSILLGVCYRYLGRSDLAKDVLQEAFIQIFKYLPDYQPTGSFTAWMKRITINTALQHLRKRSNKLESVGWDAMPEEFVHPDIYSQLAAEELVAIIETLPTGFRTIFNLHAIEGYSHKEISDLLGISESTSRSQLARARKFLQEQLIGQKKRIYDVAARHLPTPKKSAI